MFFQTGATVAPTVLQFLDSDVAQRETLAVTKKSYVATLIEEPRVRLVVASKWIALFARWRHVVALTSLAQVGL